MLAFFVCLITIAKYDLIFDDAVYLFIVFLQ